MNDDLIHLLDPTVPDENEFITVPITKSNGQDITTSFHANAAWDQGVDVDLSKLWLIDSGASRIMCSNRHWFHSFTPLTNPIMITLGDNSTIPATGQGRILVHMNAGGHYERNLLQDILYIPDMGGNLLSVSHFARCGAEVRFKDIGCKLLNWQKETTCVGSLHGNLYIMDMATICNEHAKIATVTCFPSEGEDPPPTTFATQSATFTADLTTWHHRLAHLHTDAVTLIHTKGMVTGMDITKGSTLNTPCEACLKGKQTRAEIQKFTDNQANVVLSRIFSDVCGHMTKSHEGYEYFVTWVDNKSRKVFINGIKAKSEVGERLKSFVECAELETGQRIISLRSNGGGKYITGTIQQYLNEKGIKHEITTPDTPQHNGVAERMNRTLLDKVWAMLTDVDLPEGYWYDALHYAALIHNITPTQALDGMTPEEGWSRNKPDVSNLQIFGARVYMHVSESQCGKLSAHSLVCTFLGFADQRKAYRLMHRPTHRYIESHNVIFDEGGPSLRFERIIIEHNSMPSTMPTSTLPQPSSSQPPPPTVTTVRPKRAPVVSTYKLRPRNIERTSIAHTGITPEPKTYTEVMKRPDAAMWEAACEEECKPFEAMEVFEVVPRPANKKVVGSKWVYREKRGPDGKIQKYKARVVAQGFTQVKGVDFDKTFAPVAKLSSLRAILAIAAELDLEVHQMDVKAAYLNGKLEEEVYMEPPPGFGIPEGMVLKLNKAVYRTKQGSRIWYKNVKAELESMGYMCTEANHAVFIRYQDGIVSIIVLYVDDFTLVCKDIEIIMKDKETLNKVYNMTDLGELTYILSMHVKWDRQAGHIELSQLRYIKEILERYGKSDVTPISTPTLTNQHLTKLQSPDVDTKSYQRALSALM